MRKRGTEEWCGERCKQLSKEREREKELFGIESTKESEDVRRNRKKETLFRDGKYWSVLKIKRQLKKEKVIGVENRNLV